MNLMMGWTIEMDSTPIIVSGFVQGIGMGFLFMPLNLVAFATLPPHLRTDGSSLLNLLRNLGASVGISLITTLLSRNIQTSHADLGGHITPFNIPGLDPSSAERMGSYGEAALQMLNLEVNRQAAMIAYLDDFKMMAFMVALAVPLSLFLRSPPRQQQAALPPME
jgi:DHA2 family multidrug resistance protein